MNVKVAKFGGTSLADSGQFRKVIDIIKSDRERRVIVVSAPGKRRSTDQKITDLLLEWHRMISLRLNYREVMGLIWSRFEEVTTGLGLTLDIAREIAMLENALIHGASSEYAASRGEYITGKILAEALGFEFVDPAQCILFNDAGEYVRHDKLIRNAVGNTTAVIPGFYGSNPDGSIKTFPRGGSDITGAIVARAVGASLYENWTDVSGLLMADPRIVRNPLPVHSLTYRELRELAYMGANVFHEEAMLPVDEAGIPTVIRNTNNPDDAGTSVRLTVTSEEKERPITGIAGRAGFISITLEKTLMNRQVGFARRVLTILEGNGISVEHMPGGIDSLSIFVDSRYFKGNVGTVVTEIRDQLRPEKLTVCEHNALIAVVGTTIPRRPDVAATILSALAAKGIGIGMINQGASGLSIIVGVPNSQYEEGVRAIYNAFMG